VLQRSGDNYKEHLIEPEGARVKKVKIQTTMKGELRGVEFIGPSGEKLL
jgi:hypothetical protein